MGRYDMPGVPGEKRVTYMGNLDCQVMKEVGLLMSKI